ncbi:MAG: acetyl-CoA carboxylase biotin carboxyl carrier protein subunit [Flavobacteriaceae bacterium]|nr:acetyl-CoA carboxylase biotin carboxyl carrier protein subunit [Flavobacteriaceae bacterium]
MSNTFKVKVNNSHEFEISKKEIDSLDMVTNFEASTHLLQNNKSFQIKTLQQDFDKKTYTIKVNRNTYEVIIANELDQLINQMGFSLSASKHINVIKAPMPGLILSVDVEAGKEVKEGDTLLILEAMKMENSITSPLDGVIKSVIVAQGDAVDKNQLLIEFE